MLRETIIAVGGIGVGYLLARAVLQKEYDEKLDREIERTREFYGQYEGPEDPEFMEQAIRTAEAMTDYTGGSPIVPAKLADAVTSSIVREAELTTAEAHLEDLEKLTDPAVKAKVLEGFRPEETRPPAPKAPVPYNKIYNSTVDEEVDDVVRNTPANPLDPHARPPYLITFAEFDSGNDELGYEPITVSFFAGDGIVVDEEDAVVSAERVEETIGTDNLNKFGTRTDDPDMDPNTIYVRCERYNMDFEVSRSPGMYRVEVLGESA